MISQQSNFRRVFATSPRTQWNVLQRQRQPSRISANYHVECIPSRNTMTQQRPQQTHLFNNYQTRLFATRRKRYQPNYNKSKSEEYWDKEYIKSKEHLDSINKNKLQLEEPKQLNEIISWKVLLIMAVSPLVLCLIIPDLRNQMLESFDMPASTSSTSSSINGSNQNKK
jgi:hypothetical protein